MQQLKDEVAFLKDVVINKDEQLTSTQRECDAKIDNWEEQELLRLAEQKFKTMVEEDDLSEREKALKKGQQRLKELLEVDTLKGVPDSVMRIARNKGRIANDSYAETRGLDAWCTGWLDGRVANRHELMSCKAEIDDDGQQRLQAEELRYPRSGAASRGAAVPSS